MIKVLIVDDEPLARENLRILLQGQDDIEIVGECANAVEAILARYISCDLMCCFWIFRCRVSVDWRW